MNGEYLYLDSCSADAFLATMMGGMARAQERFHASLRTVDEHGDPIEEQPKNLEEKP